MKKFKALFLAFTLAAIGCGTVYALTAECSTPTEQIKIKRKCRTCNGSGVKKERMTHGPCQGAGCNACDYNGYVIYDATCSTCGGTGWEPVK